MTPEQKAAVLEQPSNTSNSAYFASIDAKSAQQAELAATA